MDYKLNGLLRHYVLFLVLMFQWRLVFPAPVKDNIHNFLESTVSQTVLLQHEAKILLDTYTKFFNASKVPGNVPDSSVSGMNIAEKLQDVYIKDILFHLHLSKVEKYQNEVWGPQESVLDPLGQVKATLLNNLAKIQTLQTIFEIPLPPTAAPPQLSHDDDYAKKLYVWGVLVRLNEWPAQVLQVLEEAKGV